MKQNTPAAASIDARLVRRLSREYDAAIRAEENAADEAQAWRRAKASERALRRLQAAQAGLPLPVAPVPRTAKNLARGAFAALASIGRAVARAVATQAALRKAQAASAARLAARKVRQAFRRAARAVALRALALVASVVTFTAKKEIVVPVAPQLAPAPVTVAPVVIDVPVRYAAARRAGRAVALRAFLLATAVPS